jgi:hypothetical protein
VTLSSKKELLEQIRSDYKSGRLCFFLGAGASVASGLPVAKDIVEAIVQGLLDASSQPDLSLILQKTKLLDRILEPDTIDALRLEVLLGAIDSRQISNRPPNFYAANIARSIAANGKPSKFHQFLAAGLQSGQIPSILTTNWDCLLEEAFSTTDPVYIAWDTASFATAPQTRLLAKLHGTVALKDDDSATQNRKQMSLVTDSLGIGGELTEEIYDVIGRYFRSNDFSICIVGYSGRDPDIHIAFQNSTSRIFWALHQHTSNVEEMKTRVDRLMPNAQVNFIDLNELMSILSLRHCLEGVAASGCGRLPILGDLSSGARLIALGTALGHAARGDLALNCFDTAVRVEPQSTLAKYNRAREHAVMYKSSRSLVMFLKLWPTLRKSRDHVYQYELAFYILVAIENISVFGRRLTPIGRNLCGAMLALLRFSEMERLIVKLKTGSDAIWLRSEDGEAWWRLLSRYIHFSLISSRVQWYLRRDVIERRLYTALRYAKESRSPSLQGHVLRYLGRWFGLQGDYAKSDKFYEDARYWFEAISDHNGLTEVKKYQFKTLLGYPSEHRVVALLHDLGHDLAVEYPAQRDKLPLYVRNFLSWQERRGWRRACAGVMVQWWRWVMRHRWSF